MNELQVKTIEIEPAVIKFNYEDIEKELENSLKKYKGLVFSEGNETDLRKTIAELRKGKNAVDRYRIDTKKELNLPIKEFEEKCKQLDEKFTSVIDPLVEQQKEFEAKRKAEKLEKLEKIRIEHIENYGLDEEYHHEVVIEDSMLTKSASLKQSGESLEFKVKNLKMLQDKKEADKDVITTSVKLANAENELSLSIDAYIRLLDYQDVEAVKEQISSDANKEVETREQERIEKERLESEKQAKLERIEQEMKESIEQEDKAIQESVVEEEPAFDDIPFSDPFMDDPFAVEPTFEVVYKIKASNDDLQELNSYLTSKGIVFEVIT